VSFLYYNFNVVCSYFTQFIFISSLAFKVKEAIIIICDVAYTTKQPQKPKNMVWYKHLQTM
jgi:hypothetical protein